MPLAVSPQRVKLRLQNSRHASSGKRNTFGKLVISFPKANSVQAVISAISIATKNERAHPAPRSPQVIGDLVLDHVRNARKWHILSWLDTGQPQYADSAHSKATFSKLPPALYGATWIQASHRCVGNAKTRLEFKVNAPADVYVGIDSTKEVKPSWLSGYAGTGTYVENDRCSY